MSTEKQLVLSETFSDAAVSIQFSHREFERCTFRNLALQKADWRGARFEDCVFESCDLTQLKPIEVAARGIEFKNCKLMGVQWPRSHPQLTFIECSLRAATQAPEIEWLERAEQSAQP